MILLKFAVWGVCVGTLGQVAILGRGVAVGAVFGAALATLGLVAWTPEANWRRQSEEEFRKAEPTP